MSLFQITNENHNYSHLECTAHKILWCWNCLQISHCVFLKLPSAHHSTTKHNKFRTAKQTIEMKMASETIMCRIIIWFQLMKLWSELNWKYSMRTLRWMSKWNHVRENNHKLFWKAIHENDARQSKQSAERQNASERLNRAERLEREWTLSCLKGCETKLYFKFMVLKGCDKTRHELYRVSFLLHKCGWNRWRYTARAAKCAQRKPWKFHSDAC